MLTVLHAFLVQALGRLKFEHFFGQQPAEDLATNKYCELKLEDLTHLGTLGAGGFGQVDMVLTPNKEKLALKMLSKARIVQHSQVDHVISEKNVLQQLNNPFCISMCATFKDDRCDHPTCSGLLLGALSGPGHGRRIVSVFFGRLIDKPDLPVVFNPLLRLACRPPDACTFCQIHLLAHARLLGRRAVVTSA